MAVTCRNKKVSAVLAGDKAYEGTAYADASRTYGVHGTIRYAAPGLHCWPNAEPAGTDQPITCRGTPTVCTTKLVKMPQLPAAHAALPIRVL